MGQLKSGCRPDQSGQKSGPECRRSTRKPGHPNEYEKRLFLEMDRNMNEWVDENHLRNMLISFEKYAKNDIFWGVQKSRNGGDHHRDI